MSRTGTRYLLNNYRILLRIPKWQLSSPIYQQKPLFASFKSEKYTLILQQTSVSLSLELDTHTIICWHDLKQRCVKTYRPNSTPEWSYQLTPDVIYYDDWIKYIN